MADPEPKRNSSQKGKGEDIEQEAPQTDDMTGGKGRRDEVGRTGIYPSSSDDAPGDAEVRTPGELGHTVPGKEALTVVEKPDDEE